MQTCIVLKMPGANATVNTFKSSLTSLQNQGNSIESQALINATTCNQQPVTNVRQGTLGVERDANSCIKNN